MDTTKAATARKVDEAREAAGYTIPALSEASGIPYTTLWRKLKAHTSFDFDDIDALAGALDKRPSELVDFQEDIRSEIAA